MMKKGFTLIELLLSIVIAGMLSAALFATITQIGSVRETIANISSTYGRAALFQQQLQRDISGAFVPTQYDMLPTRTGETKEPAKPLENIFIGQTSGASGRLQLLTFITNNPLEVFYGVKDAKLEPRVARVVYRLEQEEKRKNSYRLMRQEGSSTLKLDAYKKDAEGQMRAFPLIEGIQDLSIRFISIEQKEDKQTKKISRTIKTVSEWKDLDKKEQAQAKPSLFAQKPVPKLPHFVELRLSLWDSSFVDSREFTITVPVQSRFGQFEQERPEKKEGTEAGSQEAEKKPDEQKETTQAKPEAPQETKQEAAK